LVGRAQFSVILRLVVGIVWLQLPALFSNQRHHYEFFTTNMSEERKDEEELTATDTPTATATAANTATPLFTVRGAAIETPDSIPSFSLTYTPVAATPVAATPVAATPGAGTPQPQPLSSAVVSETRGRGLDGLSDSVNALKFGYSTNEEEETEAEEEKIETTEAQAEATEAEGTEAEGTEAEDEATEDEATEAQAEVEMTDAEAATMLLQLQQLRVSLAEYSEYSNENLD